MGTILTNTPNTNVGSRIYKYLYLKIQDLVASKLITGELVFNQITKEHISVLGKSIDWSGDIDEIVLEGQNKFGFNDNIRCAYEIYFKDCFSPYANFVLNRLNLVLFNPYCMSPMVLFFLASKVAVVRYTPTLGIGISEFFLRIIKSYNQLLDMPLDDVVINSMYAKFKTDEGNVATSSSIWIENYNEARRNSAGFIWFNNEQDSEIYGQTKSETLWEKLCCQVYEDIKLQAMYEVCKKSGYSLGCSFLRRDVFSIYVMVFDRLLSKFQLDFYGIGVIPLFGQLLFTSIALNEDQVVRLDVKKNFSHELDQNDIFLLLETAKDIALLKEDVMDDKVSRSVITNYKHITHLVCG